MPSGTVTLPDGTQQRITANTKDELIAKAQVMANPPAPQKETSLMGPGQFVGQLAGAISTGDFSQFQDAGKQLEPVLAAGRAGLGGFFDNIVGFGDLLATTAINSNMPVQLLRQFSKDGAPDIPQIGDSVFNVDSSDLFGLAQRAGEFFAATKQGMDAGISSQEDAASQQADVSAQLQERNPAATAIGELSGDVATVLTGRAPVSQSIRKIYGDLSKNPSRVTRFIDEKIKGGARDFGKLIGRGGVKMAEAGLEGAALAVIDSGDPMKTAAYAAGAQGAGSMALTVMGEVSKRPIQSTFMGLLLAHQIYKAVGPGQRNLFEASDEAINGIVGAYGVGLLSAMAGAGRVSANGFKSPRLENAADNIITALRTGVVTSNLKDISRASVEGNDTPIRVLQALSSNPDYFGATIRNRLERAVKTGKEGAFIKEIDKLMESRSFRNKLDEIE